MATMQAAATEPWLPRPRQGCGDGMQPWLPRPHKQDSMPSWSGPSRGAVVDSEGLKHEAMQLEVLKLEAMKLEVRKLERLVELEALAADRKPDAVALGATQAQLQWQRGWQPLVTEAAAAGSQTPSSPLPPNFPWRTAANPAAVAAIAAVRAAEAARRQANARALAIERVGVDPDKGKAEAARRQAEAEGLTLQLSDNAAGYRGVYSVYRSRKTSPFKARVRRDGKQVSLGYHDTAEEAALAYARTPEAQEEVRNAKPAPLKAEEALTQVSK